jgi:hypothetical protein
MLGPKIDDRKRAPGVSEWLATFGDLSAVDTAISADGTVMVRRRFLFGNLRLAMLGSRTLEPAQDLLR